MVAQKTKAWLELLRVPNLFTVPGDVLVGWCLMGGLGHGIWPICLTIMASLCLYATGLLLNDAVDARVDARERPQRPIPSGRISLRTVFAVTSVLGTLGIVLAWQNWACAAILLSFIVFYDVLAKRIPGLGVLTMGACRGVNVLFGALCLASPEAIVQNRLMLVAIGFFVIYTLLISIVARNEANPNVSPSFWLRWSPALLTLCLVPLFWITERSPLWPPLLAVALMLPFVLLRRNIPALVAAHIRHMIPLQIVWCMIALSPDALFIPVTLLCLWVLSTLSSLFFQGS